FVYTATDDESGRLWAADGSSWVPAAPSVASANAGQIVARAALSASVVVNTIAGTPVRIPALTTPSFPCPKNATVEHSWVRFYGHGVGTSEVAQLQLRWSSDNWATSN